MRGPIDFLKNKDLEYLPRTIGDSFKRRLDDEQWVITAASAYGARQLTRWSDGKRVTVAEGMLDAATQPGGSLDIMDKVEPKAVTITAPTVASDWLDIENGTTTWHVKGVFDRD